MVTYDECNNESYCAFNYHPYKMNTFSIFLEDKIHRPKIPMGKNIDAKIHTIVDLSTI